MVKGTTHYPMRKVLIISPHFAPTNAPDMQRTRLALPYLRGCGWEPTVLAVAPDLIEGGVYEELLEKTYPPDIRIIRTRGISPRLTRAFGIGSLWLRCGRALRAAGDKLLAAEKFDLVFFSTTQFEFFAFGPRWKAKFGVPYVLDYQDPWVNDYYHRTRTTPPGGWLKFSFSQWSARHREPRILRDASGVVAVSRAYRTTFSVTYPWFDAKEVAIIPFGAAAQDFSVAKSRKPDPLIVQYDDGLFHHVYTGRCGPDMSTSLTIVFRAFKKFLAARPAEAERIRFHFIGTDYAPRPFGRDWALPVARAEGVEKYVTEHCYRVQYFDALYYLVHADALIAVGSNDPTYSASKIFPYVLAERPILLIFNAESPVIAIGEELKCGLRFGFRDSADIGPLVERVATEWFFEGKMKQFAETDRSLFLPYSAEGMTRRLADRFASAVDRNHSAP
jgi:Glycosyl transferase 4-like domain